MTVRYKVLVADKDEIRAAETEALLLRCGYFCIPCHSSHEAMSLCGSHCPDLIVLEAELSDALPELLDALRRNTSAPILVHFGADIPALRVAALDAGADDCLTRPFDEAEFLARLRRALRRSQSLGLDPESARRGTFRNGDLTVDFRTRKVYLAGADAGLTQREYRLVALLARYAGQVLGYDFISRELWGQNTPEGNQILRVNMANIRRKLSERSDAPRYIFTHPGMGYRMAAPDRGTEEETDGIR